MTAAAAALYELLRYICCHISVRTLSCGFDPVSAFTEAWCKLFGATTIGTRDGGNLDDAELLGSLGLLLHWRESRMPGTSVSLLSDLAFQCQRQAASSSCPLSWQDLARRAREEVKGIVLLHEEAVPSPSFFSSSTLTVFIGRFLSVLTDADPPDDIFSIINFLPR